MPSTIHTIRYLVILRPDNVNGTSAVYDTVVGVNPDGALRTTPTAIEPGTVVGHLDMRPNTFDESLALWEITPPGEYLNRLDEQPKVGDIIVNVCPAREVFRNPDGSDDGVPDADLPTGVFQAGMAGVVTADFTVANVANGTFLGMFPLFAGEWARNVVSTLEGALAARAQGTVYIENVNIEQAALVDSDDDRNPDEETGLDDPPPAEPVADDGALSEAEQAAWDAAAGVGQPLPPFDGTDGEQESPGVPVGDGIDAPADGTETELPAPETPDDEIEGSTGQNDGTSDPAADVDAAPADTEQATFDADADTDGAVWASLVDGTPPADDTDA